MACFAQSPDLNPTEHVWDQLGEEPIVLSRTLQELQTHFWRNGR